jgi:hypothetical protein
MLVLLVEGIYGVFHLDIFMWHDVHAKFHEDWYRRSSNVNVLPQEFEALWLVLLMGVIYELHS